ncbi:MAG: alpha/beta fold hydrolase [Acidimicrobiales bacterium]
MAPEGQDLPIPPTRFAITRDGARIAYAEFGTGPTVVAIPPTAQNIEMQWELPVAREMFERFASFCRWIHFDKRGTGCSDRRSGLPGIDERVDDLRAVMDAAGVERAHLFGASEGGPTTILFAVTYPERVESITIWGSGARSMPDLSDEDRVLIKGRMEALSKVWGTPDSFMVDGFAPSMAPDPTYRAWHQRYERYAADSQSLVELMEMNLDIDVSDVLGQVSVPTLIIHRTDDQVVPVQLARDAAAAIPGATLSELPGADHFGYAGDFHAWIDEMERFVTGAVKPRPQAAPRTRPHIVTLGRFAVVGEDGDLPVSEWGSRLPRLLCKRLVAARGWPVPREELFELLWPGESDRRRLGARLSVHLSTLRRILGGGVRADRQTVALDLAEVSTDLEALFGAESDEATVDCYTGEFLPEERAEDWSSGARAEARGRFALAARRLLAAANDGDDHQRAIDLARRLIEADQFDDNAHRHLIVALNRIGEPGLARQAHASWQAAMAELGVDAEPLEAVLKSGP